MTRIEDGNRSRINDQLVDGVDNEARLAGLMATMSLPNVEHDDVEIRRVVEILTRDGWKQITRARVEDERFLVVGFGTNGTAWEIRFSAFNVPPWRVQQPKGMILSGARPA